MTSQKLPFTNFMDKTEHKLAMIYTTAHVFLIPLIITLYAFFIGTEEMEPFLLTAITYALGMLFALLCMRRFLRLSFDHMLNLKLRTLSTLLMAQFLFALLFQAYTIGMILFGEAEITLPEFGVDSIRQNFSALFALNVFVEPVVEELLHRGLIFGSLRMRNRTAAYIVSVAFELLSASWLELAFGSRQMGIAIALQYLPGSIVYSWCYEHSSSIWVPIMFRGFINAVILFVIAIA